MGETTPETTAQLVSQILDCLVQLEERWACNVICAVAIKQMRFYAESLIEIPKTGR